MSTIVLIGRTPAACRRAAIQAGGRPDRHLGDGRRISRAQFGVFDGDLQTIG